MTELSAFYSIFRLDQSHKSPDKKVTASFVFAGEIRFGPVYFNLSVGDYEFGERIFGDSFLWSSDSSFFAVQEWLTTDYVAGPYTELLLIDFNRNLECAISKANKGFIVPVRFEPPLLIYSKSYSGETREFEIEYSSLDRWKPIAAIRKT